MNSARRAKLAHRWTIVFIDSAPVFCSNFESELRMITEPTLFILGAGASKPYGYPTGRELRKQIIKESPKYFGNTLDKTPRIPDHNKHIRNVELGKFVHAFEKSSVESIDKWLSFNPKFSDYGKIAITLCIKHSETTSHFREVMPSEYYSQDWYTLLFSRMASGLKGPKDLDKFKNNRVAFVTFNYDRSFEYFLHESFVHAFWQELTGQSGTSIRN